MDKVRFGHIVDLRFVVLPALMFVVQLTFGQLTDRQAAEQTAQRAELLADSNDLYNSVLTYSQALEQAQRCSDIDSTFLHELMYNYALTLTYIGDYDTAIEVIAQLLDMLSNSNDDFLRARLAMQTGIIYFFKNDLDEALQNYHNAKDIAEKIGNKSGISIVYNNIGNIHQKRGEYDLARNMYDRSLTLQNDVNDSATICNTLFNIGTCYEENSVSDTANDYYNRAYDIAKAINDVEIMSLCQLHRSAICMQNNDLHNAGTLLDESETMTKQHQYNQVLLDVLLSQEALAEKQHNYARALAYNKEYQALYDSIFNEDMNNRLNVLKIRNNVQRKEFEITSQKAVIKRQHDMAIGLIIGLVICAIMVVMLLIIRWLQQRHNKDLLRISHAKDRLFSIVSHDLTTPAMAQQNMLRLLVDNYDALPAENVRLYCRELLKSNSGLVELLTDLLRWSQMEAHKLIFRPVEFDMRAVVDEAMTHSEEAAAKKDITMVNNIPPATTLRGDRNMIKTVMRNLLSNAVKFSHTGERVLIDFSDDKRKSTVTVSDKGVVIGKKDLAKLFRADKYLSSVGTSGERGNGMGLLICKEIMKYHRGRIFAESDTNSTRFSFTINKADNGRK